MSKKKRTKLKKIELTSVDMVRRGANQEAYINLYKSAGDPAEPNAPSEPPATPNPGEIPQGMWKSIAEVVKGFLGKGEGEAAYPEDIGMTPEELEKAAETFQTKREMQEVRDDRWRYHDALNMSIDSILEDCTLTVERKEEMLAESILQFSNAYMEMCEKLLKATANTNTVTQPAEVGKSQDEAPDNKEEGEEEMKIDKSRFTQEELEQYEALINKGKVEDDEPEKKNPEDKKEENLEKSAEMHPEVKKALEDMEVLKKNMEMKEMADIAKKYAPLGKKEDELAATLYEMKKSNQANYDAYISVLDQNLELLNKSGIFEEIGKSGYGSASGVAKSEPVAKIEGIAKGYMEKDPSLDYNTAVAKAWENNPDLMAAYDEEY